MLAVDGEYTRMIPGYIVLFATACPFNLCLVYVIARTRPIRTVTNVLIASLATSDLMLAVLVVPAEMFHFLVSDFKPQGIYCVLHQSVQVFIPLVSVLHLLSIAVERYVKIVHPLKYAWIATKTRVAMVIAVLWLFPLFVSLLPSFGWNNLGTVNGTAFTNYFDQVDTCSYLETMACSYMSLIFAFFVLTLLTMVTLYVRIFSIALSQARQIASVTFQRAGDQHLKTELKALIVLAVTVGFFACSWLPIASVVVYDCANERNLGSVWWTVSLFIAYLNSSINPLIYGIGNRDIRRTFIRRLRCKARHQIHPDTLSSVCALPVTYGSKCRVTPQKYPESITVSQLQETTVC